VREVRRPGVDGQIVVAEDRAGTRWRIECLGSPVEVGARVAFVPLDPASDRRGEMLRIVDAPRASWVATLRRDRNALRLTPFGGVEAPELRLAEADAKGAEDGDRVVVVPTGRRSGRPVRGRGGRRGERDGVPVRVVEVLGPPFEPESDFRALVWKHRLEPDTSRRARLEAEALEAGIPPVQLARRVDLRHLPFVTIDPASARDHDDAVFAEPATASPLAPVGEDPASAQGRRSSRSPGFRWRLWVAIADVAHFVHRGGFIDAEARRRGNSVYFPDRAIPMLPERLSSDLCSLRPDEDRLAMVVELRVDGRGRVVDALFHEAVVRSQVRLSYEEAARLLDGSASDGASSAGPRPADAETATGWRGSLRCLDAVTRALLDERLRAGSIDLDLPELDIETDETGHARDAHLRERSRAHRLVEDAMLAANRAVARALDRAEREAIHRVHPPPTPAKLATLGALVDRLGLGEDFDPEDRRSLVDVLAKVKGTGLEERINGAGRRSMSQARDAAASAGHYALHFEHYVHFTSPIRRYADLEIHRALKAMLAGDRGASERGEGAPDAARAERLSIWLSGRERVAVDVERDAEALACCAILHGREGERFDASVTGVAEFGLFVRLDSPSASGLVPLRTLDGEWRFDPETEALVGERSGRRFETGESVRVELVEVDADRARLGFRLAQR
jgi:ribonuclease R